MIYLSPPTIEGNEVVHIGEALDQGYMAPCGPTVDEFEAALAEYVGVNHAIAVNSGTAALHLALLAAGIGDGMHVCIPDLSFVATANAVLYTGAAPVFVATDPGRWTMDPVLLADVLEHHSPSPSAVISVDLFGRAADHHIISEICEIRGIPYIVDAAQSMGSEHRAQKCGSFGDIAITSFNGNKIMTTSAGGAVFTDNTSVASIIRGLADQAKTEGSWQHDGVGYNYRMSNVLAAIGLAQLRSLDKFVKGRRDVFARYQYLLGSHRFVSERVGDRWNRWLSVFRTKRPEEQIYALNAHEIEARRVFRPLWDIPHLGEYPAYGDEQIAKDVFGNWICLPSGPQLTKEEQNEVIYVLRKKEFVDMYGSR